MFHTTRRARSLPSVREIEAPPTFNYTTYLLIDNAISFPAT